MQEDQIYAMQDYMQQYQQLVCQYRSENASLRRQLAEGHADDSYDDAAAADAGNAQPAARYETAPNSNRRERPADNSRNSRTTRKLKCRMFRRSRRRHGTIESQTERRRRSEARERVRSASVGGVV